MIIQNYTDKQRAHMAAERKDLNDYYRSMKEELTAEQEWDSKKKKVDSAIKLMQELYKLPTRTIEAAPAKAATIIFSSTMDNPKYVRTIDENPNAARAMTEKLGIEQSILNETVMDHTENPASRDIDPSFAEPNPRFRTGDH